MRLEGTNLVIPQSDIRVLDLASDVSRGNPPSGGVGWIPFQSGVRPVYCLSPTFRWLTAVQNDCPVCALVGAGENVIGLFCSEVVLVRAHEIILHDIPDAMATPQNLYDRLAICRGELACVSSAERILAYLDAGRPIADNLQETS